MRGRARLAAFIFLSALPPLTAALRWADVPRQPDAWHASAEARAIADNVLLYQDLTGGWPKNRDMTLAPAAEVAARGGHVPEDETLPTIDNGATHTQLRFLARILATGSGTPADRAAFDRGLAYLLAAQYPNGGWPQFHPLRRGYYTHITFNDDAMTGVLGVLHGVADGREPFAFASPAQRAQAAAAVARGVDCILRCQVVQGGQRTVWCAQHDERTLAPAPARKFEPAALSGLESVGLVRFLMTVEPTAEVVTAIESAVAWFQAVKITGLRYERFPVPGLAKGDSRVVPDPAAPALWARFYELGTDRPVFTGRDGVVHYRLDEIEAERRGGYVWYVTAPEKLLTKDYPAWRRRLDAFTVANAERKLQPQYPQIRRPAPAPAADVIAREDLTYAPRRQLDLYLPPGPGPHPVVLIEHGGGWDSGSREMERPFARHLAARGYATAPVSYRLGPAGRFPAALHDLKAAVRWLRAHAAEHGLDSARIAVVGMSAGGQLAALLGATNGLEEFEGVEGETGLSSAVQAVVDIDGLADFTAPELVAQQAARPSAPVRFLGGTFAERPETWRAASALTHAGRDSAPTLFINSTVTDPILPGRESLRDRLRAAGVASEIVVLPDTPHPFWLFHPWFEPTLAAVDTFLRARFGMANPAGGATMDAASAPMSAAVPAPWVADLGDGRYRNPVIHADYSDPDVVRVGDDFWMTSSSFGHVPGLPLLHSRDLVNWTLTGHALPRLVPEDVFRVPQHGKGVWAPAIRHHAGKYWIYYPDPDFGLYVITAADPRGPWSEPVLVRAGKGLIDPCPLWDDDGRVWLVHAWAKSRAGINNLVTLLRLSADGTRVEEDCGVIIHGDQVPGCTTLEGPKLYRRNGWYYVFAPAGGVGTGWQSVFRARDLRGPYEHRVVLARGQSPVNGPHQGALVDTPTGAWWFVHFQDQGPSGRIVHLQPVAWCDDWPVMGTGVVTGDATGEPVLVHAKPALPLCPVAVPATSDDFSAPTLAPQWQWQANPAAGWFALGARPGVLRLFAQPAPKPDNLYDAPNLLMQKFPAADFAVTTQLEFSPQAGGESAGLIVFGYDYAWIGLRATAAGVQLVQEVKLDAAEKAVAQTTVVQPKVSGPVWLRVTITGGAQARFACSLDGRQFVPAGVAFTAKPGRWVGAKVGLFALGRPDAPTPGWADFHRFTVTSAL